MTVSFKDIAQGADSALNSQLLDIGGTQITLATVLSVVLIVALTLWLSRLLQRLVALGFQRRGVDDPGTIGVLQRLIHYLSLVVGVGVGLQTLGVQLGALFAAGAVFAVGVGFAMQTMAENFVSGVLLLLERSIKPQDVLIWDGQMVRVEQMGIRSTIVRTLDGEELIVPNSKLVQSTVNNSTLHDKDYRLRVQVGVHYGSDMAQVRQVLERMARELTWCKRERNPMVLLMEFGSSSVNWEVSVWIVDPWRRRIAASQLREAIWQALQEHGIVIAYPQLDLHLDPQLTRGLRAVGGGAG